MKFHKVLAKYYENCYRKCYDSIEYCMNHKMYGAAQEFRNKVQIYFDFINEHWDEIEFYRIDNNAHLTESATEEKLREFQSQNLKGK